MRTWNRGLRAVGIVAAFAVTLAMVVDQLAIVTPAAQAATQVCSGGSLYVAAHEDDDLLFMSPDLLADVTDKRCTSSLFLTAGDAGLSDAYWQDRERGIENAYAYMADVSNSWTTSTVALAGKDVRLRTLNGAPQITLMFMRLPDGFPLGVGSAQRGNQSMKRLLDGAISSIQAVDGSATYTATQLRNSLIAAMQVTQAADVHALDYVSDYGFDGDHFDHHSAGYLARDAADSYTTPHILRSYLGYDSTEWEENVSGTDLERKREAFFDYYAPFDSQVSAADYERYDWFPRQHVIDTEGDPVAANAGPDQTAPAGQLVTLDGSGSASTGSLSYAWTQTGGPAVTLSGATSVKPTLVPPVAGTYTFRLTASDGSASNTDTVVVTVSAANQATMSGVTATASSQEVSQPANAVRDGSLLGWPDDPSKEWASVGGKAGTWVQLAWANPVLTDSVVLYDRPNADDRVLSGTLTFSDGSTVAVGQLANSGGTTITFPQRATSTIRFTVDSVSTDTKNIGLAEFQVLGQLDKAPVANAGPDQTVATNTRVTLDASASSDPDPGATLSYRWAKTSGPAATLSSTTVPKPTFTPTVAGTYVFELTVSDGAMTAKDTVVINVGAPSRAPVANAGPDQAVVTNTRVTLDASASSDPDPGTTLSYRWAKTSGPAATLSSTTVPKPTFTPTAAGTYVFELTVSDGALTAKDTVSITVTTSPVNVAPVANAGPDQAVAPNALVTLDGSTSSDPNPGTTLSYKWAKTSGPAATLSSTTVPKPTFTPTAAGTYVFELTVSDGTLTAKDTVSITVQSSTNVARLPGVVVTQSSQSASQEGTKAIDGVAQGYPGDYTREWATAGGKAGSWIKLAWASPTRIDRIVLNDRPNTNDRVLGGTLVFSDGTQVAVPSLDNAGAATTITFPARTVTSVQLNIGSVSTSTDNIGLAEFEVWGSRP